MISKLHFMKPVIQMVRNSISTSVVLSCVMFCSMAVVLTGCGLPTETGTGNITQTDSASEATVITDSLGNQVTLKPDARVVSVYGSFAECWLLSGGNLIGVTQDAIDERNLSLSDDIAVIGSVKEPNIEQLVALQPDYVILSADLTPHLQLEASLKQLGIAYGYYSVDTFDDYDAMMQQFCAVNQRPDLYEANVTAVKNQINSVKEKVQETQNGAQNGTHEVPSVLLIRAYTGGMKAKGDDNLAGVILKEFGCHNIIDDSPSLLEDLSVEEIITMDPDYIFVLTMGDEAKALKYMETNVLSNPSWSNLSAVQNNHYVVLPKDLFHYKPNNRWGESYEYLKEILFP